MAEKKKKVVSDKVERAVKDEVPVDPNPDRLRVGQRFQARIWHLAAGYRYRDLVYAGKRKAGNAGYMYVATDGENEYFFNAGTWNLLRPRR